MASRSALFFLLMILACRGDEVTESEELTLPLNQDLNPTLVPKIDTDEEIQQQVENKDTFRTGCITNIKTDVENLPELVNDALKDIQLERDSIQALIEILQVQREIVAGVKYGLLLKIAPTTCSKNFIQAGLGSCPVDESAEYEYCKIDFLQKPWLAKDKFIIANNCTKSKSYSYPNLPKPVKAQSTESDDMSIERMLELESQIIPYIGDKEEVKSTHFESDSTAATHLLIDDKSFLDTYFGNLPEIINLSQQTKSSVKTTAVESDATAATILSSDDKSFLNTYFGNLPESVETNGAKSSVLHAKISENVNSKSDESTDNKLESDNSSSEEGGRNVVFVEYIRKRRANADTSEEYSKSNETSVETEKLKKSSEESSEENHKRNRRGTKDSRAQSSLEKNDEKQDVSLNTLIKKRDDSESTSLSTEEDSITRHKRKADSSSESTSSSDEGDNNNNNYKRKSNIQSENLLRQRDDNKNNKNVNKYDNDTSSSSSSNDDNNIGKNKRSIDSEELDEKLLIQNLAKYVTSLFDGLDNDSDRQISLSAIKLQRSEVEGYIYNLKLKIASTNCKEDTEYLRANLLEKYSSDDEICKKVLIPNSVKYCKVQVHVSVVYTNPKLLSSQCQGDSRNNRKKRSIPGGINASPVDDPDVVKYTKESLRLLDGVSTHPNKHKIVDITKASKQIVSGVLYRIHANIGLSDCPKTDLADPADCGLFEATPIKKCKIVIWNQPWVPKGRRTNITCDDNDEKHYFRSKRQTHPLGGINELPTDDKSIVELIEHTLKKLDEESTHGNKYKIDKILAASKQLVSGILYRIKAQIVVSDCPKSDEKNRSECGVFKESSPKTCYIEIWDRPWLPKGRQINVTCDDINTVFRGKRSTDDGSNDKSKAAIRFLNFMAQYNVSYYSKQELKHRYAVFRENLKTIKLLNDFELGTGKYGITRFADLTADEFRKNYLGLRMDLKNGNEIPFTNAEIPDIELPTEFDWRTKGAVAEVKDQGSCGSCWAFSTTGNIEGQYAIKYGQLLEFSEQELVDCDSDDEGCGGGLMDNAYRAIEKLGGLELERDYPYDAENEKCHFNKTLAKVQLSGALNISQNEDDMAKWLTQNGPIAIAINANAMQFYVGGVSHPWKFLCNPKNLDHGVLIVGYGVHDYPVYKKSLPFWIVKNSWGKNWGESGYYRVYRGDGTCGLNQTPSSGIVE